MRKALVLAAVAATCTMVAPGTATASGFGVRLQVRNVAQVERQTVPTPGSGGQSDVVVQSAVAAAPARPAFAVAVTEEGLQVTPAGTFGVALGVATTHSGGATWRSQVVAGVTVARGGQWQGVSWPTAAVGADGTVYVGAALRQSDLCDNGLGVLRSVDGGRTFGPLTVLRHETSCLRLDGRDSLAIDTDSRSSHRGRLYLGWTQVQYDAAGNQTGQQQLLMHSDDRARTWSAPLALTLPGRFTQGTNIVISPDGTVTDVYYAFPDDVSHIDIVARSSHDGGRSFAAPATVTRWMVGTSGAQNVRCCQPSAAVDPVTGEMYVAVADARLRQGRYDDALVFRSADGRHWSSPAVANIDDPRTAREHITPEVAAYGGKVYVSWTLLPGGNRVRQQASVSADGGAAFGVPTTLGPDGNLTSAATAPGFGYWLGDVTGIVAVQGHAFVSWPQPGARSSPQQQTLYAASVSLRS